MSDDRAADVEVLCVIRPLLIARVGKFETLHLMHRPMLGSENDGVRRADSPKHVPGNLSIRKQGIEARDFMCIVFFNKANCCPNIVNEGLVRCQFLFLFGLPFDQVRPGMEE